MPSIRSGFGSDFVLKNGKIGIGSETPTNILDFDGAIKGNFSIAGVATLTSYGGFVAQNQHINKASTIGFGTVGLQTAGAAIGVGATHVANQYYETETGFTDLGGVHHGDDQYYNTLSEDLVIDEGQILNITSIDMVGFTTIGEYDPHSHQSHVCLGALEEVSVTNHFSVPCGGSNDRKDSPIEGTVRFNDDLNTLEFFNGNEWKQFTYNQGQSGRAVVFGGLVSGDVTVVKTIGYWNIHTLGNAQHFGEATLLTRMNAGCSNGSRGLFAGAFPANQETIEYVTIPSEGNSIDFGDLSGDRGDVQMGSASSSTRGIWAGGAQEENIIDYVEMATLGDALDFGDLTQGRRNLGGFSSPTRGVFSSGGETPSFKNNNDYITIASKGNAILWNEIVRSGLSGNCASNQIRGVFAGGYNTVDIIKSMDYVTIASLGNTIEFGDLSVGRNGASAASTQTRVAFAGGFTTFPSSTSSVAISMEYIEIASMGNAIDFGDYLTTIAQAGATSDSHGGLGGF